MERHKEQENKYLDKKAYSRLHENGNNNKLL
jgi:hypothetical protein